MELNDQQLDRYARHIVLRHVGGAGQKKLLDSRVLVVGAGGLGSPILMYLAAAGVGVLGIIDDDIVDISNLQRQIIHKTGAVGTRKTASAKDTLQGINPDTKFELFDQRLVAENAEEIIGAYDIVADGCDNFETRLIVNRACVATRTPLVSGALNQFDGQLATFRPHDTDDTGAALPCYQCFVSDNPAPVASRSCSEQGILGAVAGIIGTMQATEIIKELLGLGDSLAGRILLFDALSGRQRIVRLRRDPECPVCRHR
jgi:molybdopterin-synthase adenylyltransferase